MKFFVLTISCLVLSITIPKISIAQDRLAAVESTLKEKRLRPDLQSERKIERVSPQAEQVFKSYEPFLEKGTPIKVDAKVLKQMQHEQEISAQFLELFAVDASQRDFISLEATLVDLKGQCSASFDRLLDLEEDVLPKPCQQFYQVLLNQFVPKAEALLEVAWEGKTSVLDEAFEQEYKELKEYLLKVEEHYAQL